MRDPGYMLAAAHVVDDDDDGDGEKNASPK